MAHTNHVSEPSVMRGGGSAQVGIGYILDFQKQTLTCKYILRSSRHR